ncbi:MAG: hypothetical protein H0U61_00035 [Nocardioidaceae bacterium]|jgi:hypothetical protein|nr:hypothetical protein [Nocardioidaceae bacterium]
MANTVSRAMHDAGLAAWFGGTLANAVALNPAAAEAGDDSSTGRVANAGWDRWTPVNAGAIGVHLIGAIGQLVGNKSRVAAQEGVASMTVTKTVLTAAALGATAYSRVLGKKVSQYDDVPADSGTAPVSSTPDDAASAQKQLAILQWLIPALTGALVLTASYAGEQQRATEVHKGIAARLMS